MSRPAPATGFRATKSPDNGLIGINLGPGGVTANDPATRDIGANNLQNFPVLTFGRAATGTDHRAGHAEQHANTTFRIEFFGERGGIRQASARAATPRVRRTSRPMAAGTPRSRRADRDPSTAITAVTATDRLDGNTSEFSAVHDASAGAADVRRHQHQRQRRRLAAAGDPEREREHRHAGHDRVRHSGTGPHTIAPLSALPTITRTRSSIDGTTEPDFAAAPIVELNGSGAGAGVHGLKITAGNYGRPRAGDQPVHWRRHLASRPAMETVTGNYIGTDVGDARPAERRRRNLARELEQHHWWRDDGAPKHRFRQSRKRHQHQRRLGQHRSRQLHRPERHRHSGDWQHAFGISCSPASRT